jgi:MFS family permease
MRSMDSGIIKSAMRAVFGDTFASLSVRNFRLYFIGIGFSHIGSWMQAVALGWLIFEMTGSGTALGTMLAARFAPMFFGGLWGGTIVDRFDTRRLLVITQVATGILALFLAALVLFGAAEAWMVYVIAVVFGILDVVDRPARQSFLHDMVGPEHLQNAISLASAEANAARLFGPLVAGLLIASFGTAWCFVANALSYAIFLYYLSKIERNDLHPIVETTPNENYSALEGLSYAMRDPLLRTILIAMALVGTFSYEFQTSLPIFAERVFSGDASDYAALMSAMGAGSIAGGLFAASRKAFGVHEFVLWAFLFGVGIGAAAISPTLGIAVIGMGFVGFFSVCLTASGNTLLQLHAEASKRGRVLALWNVAIFGSTLIGAPIVGAVGENISARLALALGAIAAIAAALYAHTAFTRGYSFGIPALFSKAAARIVEREQPHA